MSRQTAEERMRDEGLSGIEPARDPVAGLEDFEDDNETQSEIEDLRSSIEDLKTHLATAASRADKLDRDIDGMVALHGSARIRLKTVLAIHHLRAYCLVALSYEAIAEMERLLNDAITDLDKAEVIADRMPF